MITPTVEVFFDMSEVNPGDYFTLDSGTRGLIEDASSVLGGDVATDITSYVYDVSFSRGRTRAFEEYNAGVCQVRLRNYDGRFLPPELGDDVYGLTNIVPGKRVRVSIGATVVFTGTVDDWSYSYSQSGEVDAQFVASDELALVALKEMDAWQASSGDTARTRISTVLGRGEVSYPIDNTDLDDGLSPLQSDLVEDGTNVLSYLQLVALSDQGSLFASKDGKLTFRNRVSHFTASGTSMDFSDTGTDARFHGVGLATAGTMLYNRATVSRAGGEPQISESEPSISTYGPRAASLSSLLLRTDGQCKYIADYIVSAYDEPVARIANLTVILDALTTAQQASLVALELTDLISVTWTPKGATSPVTQESVIEGISHRRGINSGYVVELALSPTMVSQVLILDDATLGKLDTGTLVF